MTRTYTVKTESNQLRGIEAATLILVLDQHGICWSDRQISRDEFDSSRAYYAAIEDARHKAKAAWPDEHCDLTSEAPCAHESVTTADGHGAFCKHCGETLA